MNRRRVLGMGGGMIAVLSLPPWLVRADVVVDIAMMGRPDGSEVWFDPAGIRVRPGQTLRWTNRDAGNAHTATAYHPVNFDRQRRIPRDAKPWDSNYLLPGEAFSATLNAPGVYDYYCVPHEQAGMVGRIIVDAPNPDDGIGEAGADDGLPEAALKAFPSVEEIMSQGVVRRG